MLSKRIQEVLAMLVIGDGVIELLFPRKHVLLWRDGPPIYRAMIEPFLRWPGVLQILGAAEVALGIWWAARHMPR